MRSVLFLFLFLASCGSPAPEARQEAGKPPSQALAAPAKLADVVTPPAVAVAAPAHPVEGSVAGTAHNTGDQLVTIGTLLCWVGGIALAAGIFSRILLAFAAASNPVVGFITHYGGTGLANLVLESGGVAILTGLLLTWIGIHLWLASILSLVALVIYKWKKIWSWSPSHLHVIEDGASKLIVRADKK